MTTAEQATLERAAGPNATESDLKAAMEIIGRHPVSQAELDASTRLLHQAQSQTVEASNRNASIQLATLVLPATDTLSVFRYCAFFTRYTNASDPSSLNDARKRVGLKASNPKIIERVKVIPFGDLFPTIEPTTLSFDRTVSGPLSEQVFFNSDTGNCSILSLEPGAYEKTNEWVRSAKSELIELSAKNQSWKVFGFRNPTFWEQNVRVFIASPTPAMKSVGVTAALVVAVTGLP